MSRQHPGRPCRGSGSHRRAARGPRTYRWRRRTGRLHGTNHPVRRRRRNRCVSRHTRTDTAQPRVLSGKLCVRGVGCLLFEIGGVSGVSWCRAARLTVVMMSHSTVGLPRLSMTSRPLMPVMVEALRAWMRAALPEMARVQHFDNILWNEQPQPLGRNGQIFRL